MDQDSLDQARDRLAAVRAIKTINNTMMAQLHPRDRKALLGNPSIGGRHDIWTSDALHRFGVDALCSWGDMLRTNRHRIRELRRPTRTIKMPTPVRNLQNGSMAEFIGAWRREFKRPVIELYMRPTLGLTTVEKHASARRGDGSAVVLVSGGWRRNVLDHDIATPDSETKTVTLHATKIRDDDIQVYVAEVVQATGPVTRTAELCIAKSGSLMATGHTAQAAIGMLMRRKAAATAKALG